MSKPSRRPGREALKKLKKDAKRAEKDLNKHLRDAGLSPSPKIAIPNRKSQYKTIEEEKKGRNEVVVEKTRIFQAHLPRILKRLSKIPDPRNPKKLKHKMTVLMLYGILTFVFQMSSRRQANEKMTNPMFFQNLKLLFPELESIPHNDTLMRLLARIDDINEIENAQIELVKSLIKKKKFKQYLINGRYPVAIDGTQKLVRDYLWSEECLERNIRVKKDEDPKKQYYVYVLEATLAFENGMTIPFMTEFLSYTEGDTGTCKQDCEQKAFKRLAARLKAEFKKLSIMILVDGLYPNGPIMDLCRKNRWDFMIVLQNKSLPSVWEEYNGLLKIVENNSYKMNWGKRKQHFKWVNDIYYYYDKDKKLKIHVVVCQETWQALDKKIGKIIPETSRHAWISSEPLGIWNVHERCNLGARHRWNIENGILVEKRHGYQYEHCFSYDWNAMKGYHFLMHIGLTLNVLAQYSECLIQTVREKGVRGFIDFFRETISGPWLDISLVKSRLTAPFQLRLI